MSRRRWRGGIIAGAALLAAVWWWRCLPTPLFDAPYSTVVEAADGTLLSARIATDEQWRFPPGDTLDPRYVRCVELYEDEYFRYHPGLNPVSVGRALRQNWRAGRVVSGGSTITQQAVRLMRGNEARTWWEKLVEVAWATRLELTYSKDDILALYAAHAPFGGNVVGLEAAAWRYYGRAAEHLSWAEAAALAVLPMPPASSTRDARTRRSGANGTDYSTNCTPAASWTRPRSRWPNWNYSPAPPTPSPTSPRNWPCPTRRSAAEVSPAPPVPPSTPASSAP